MPNANTSGRIRTWRLSRQQSRRLVRHGEIFSPVMHGASLLYNLALSELRQRDDWIEGYQERLATWATYSISDAVRAGRSTISGLSSGTRRTPSGRPPSASSRSGGSLVLLGSEQVVESPAARQLVEDGTIGLKTGQSRYANRGLRDRWGGASGAERMSFRWSAGAIAPAGHRPCRIGAASIPN